MCYYLDFTHTRVFSYVVKAVELSDKDLLLSQAMNANSKANRVLLLVQYIYLYHASQTEILTMVKIIGLVRHHVSLQSYLNFYFFDCHVNMHLLTRICQESHLLKQVVM